MPPSEQIKRTRRLAARNVQNLGNRDPDKAADLRAVLATNLRRLREDRQLPRTHLADKAGVNRAHLIQVENGVRFVSLRIIGQLARALDVEAFELLKPTNDQNSRKR